MFFVTLFVAVVITVNGQRSPEYRNKPENEEGPKLYSFNYRSILKDGTAESSRSESSDGTGKVEGSYSINNEGLYRVVEYVADQDGFRAVIRTNEPGTKSSNPANVIIQSESGPIEYNAAVRRPAVEEAVSPVVAPEPGRAPVYRRPDAYSGRSPRLNVLRDADPDQNVPINRNSDSSSVADTALESPSL